MQTAEREGSVERALGGAVERAVRRRRERGQIARIFVEDRVDARARVAVVERERRGEAALRQTQLALELLQRVARRAHGVSLVGGLLEHRVVYHEPRATAAVQERYLAEPPVIGVFVHEALPLRVDEHAALEAPGLRHGQRDRDGVHVQRGGARGETELDTGAVVALGAHAHAAAASGGRALRASGRCG